MFGWCVLVCVTYITYSCSLFPPVPTLMARLTLDGSPVAGQSFSLTCSVTGADSLSPTISYQFTQDNTGGQIEVRATQTTPILTFNPLVLSDSGQYRCEVNVTPPYLNNSQVVSSAPVNLTVQSE